MNITEIIAKINEMEAKLAELKASLEAEVASDIKTIRLAFVNFHQGGKSYAYNTIDGIAEGDIVLVPTASQGDVTGVVTYVGDFAENALPFNGEIKDIIGKLDDPAVMSAHNITTGNLIAYASALAPAIADKATAKASLLAYLGRSDSADADDTADDDEE